MITGFTSERRLHPRIENSLPVRLAVNGYDFSTATKNISPTGAYCRINKYIPPFTRVAVRIRFSVFSDNRKKDLSAECRGVVVRSEDAQEGGFNIAIFFNDIKESESKKIHRYVNSCLSPAGLR